MQVSVVIQKLKGTGFRAKTVSNPLMSAEGPTRDIALASLRGQLIEQFEGEEVVSLDIPVPADRAAGAWESNPWSKCAGAFKDDPMFDQVLENMKAYRKIRDQELDQIEE